MNIGTPLIPSPIYNADGDLQQSTNRIRTFHLGLEGQPATCWSYRLLATHTTNWGTYYVPLTHPARQFSAMLEVDWMPRQLNGWTGTVAIATDKSMLIGNNTALQIGIRKTFSKP